MAQRGAFRQVGHEVDLCVVGGGMAGLCAALAAARHGARVVLMHERPVLGGNASSECRVPISGADRSGGIPYLRETGILEELRLENCRRNPHLEYSLWDLVLYEAARREPNLTLLLNCSCLDAELEGDLVTSVTGWQCTTESYHTVRARSYADCSGDGVLAPLTNHPFRMGREGREEYGESIAPETADRRTMGHTCFLQARQYDAPQPFEPPDWAYRFDSVDDLPYEPYGRPEMEQRRFRLGYWWVELGGEADTIHDTEALRDELLRIAFGVWDHIKNRRDYGADNWALEWVQFLPAKRESRRYIGTHVLTQHDLESEGRFDDVVAYGGWTMDDHHPAGFWAVRLGQPATIFHPTPSPYGIPYRSLYSNTVRNLMFAGRCFSATHAALSSARVMGTCSTMGQAVGTAAALAAAKGLLPGQLGEHLPELQQALLADDCYLPWIRQEMPPLTRTARLTASQGNPEPVRDGIARPVGEETHAWSARPGDWIAYEFDAEQQVREVALALDSSLEKDIALSLYSPSECSRPPGALPRKLRVEVRTAGQWETVQALCDNAQRFLRLPLARRAAAVRVTLEDLWGADETRVYGFVVR
jgi:hypothetical protein